MLLQRQKILAKAPFTRDPKDMGALSNAFECTELFGDIFTSDSYIEVRLGTADEQHVSVV